MTTDSSLSNSKTSEFHYNWQNFVTFCDAKDARVARRDLHGRMVGPKRIEIKLSHWNSGRNPIPHRLRQRRPWDA